MAGRLSAGQRDKKAVFKYGYVMENRVRYLLQVKLLGKEKYHKTRNIS